MLILNVENNYTFLKNVTEKTIRLLQDVTSYTIKGSFFSKAFRDKVWDGKEKLLVYSKNSGYKFPTGLLKDVTTELKKLNIKFKVNTKNRRKVSVRDHVLYSWNKNIKLRPYQLKAFKSITKKGLYYGNGILKMPIRSGKTKTVAWLIGFLSVRTLMVVPSKELLHQTIKSLKESLLLTDVGIIGDGHWEEYDCTVATIQTLTRAMTSKDKRFEEISNNYDCLVVDEVHHMTAPTWSKAIMSFDVPYKIGLSATAFPEKESEWEKGVIWLKATCGNIRIDVPTTELVEKGYLTAPDIILHQISKPNCLDKGWSQKLRNECIYENDYRNNKIVKIAKRYTKKGLLVLIVTNRLNQVDILSKKLDKKKVSHYTVTSRDNSVRRREKVKDFVEHSVNVLVGTVLSEGVDIPTIDVVIVADGGLDQKSTWQKMRNLTISPGKKKAYVVDFVDLTSPYFAKHSKERLAVYRSEESFSIKIK